MKASISVILCVASVASCISVRANYTDDWAAARAALEQRLYELDHLAVRPLSDSNSAVTTTQTVAPAASATNVAAASPASTVPADNVFTSSVPTANASAQAAALAAVEQKMNELNQTEAGSRSDTNATVAPVVIPANEASAPATPVTEAPVAEAPVAVAPAIASAAVTPVSSAPAVVAPAPRAAAAPAAAAAVAAVPAASLGTVAMPTRTLPAGSAGQLRPSNELVTTTGATYKNVEVQKVMSDAIVISYTPAQGGWAMTKVYFQDLPPEIRQEYGKP